MVWFEYRYEAVILVRICPRCCFEKKKKYRYAQLMKIIRSGDFPAFGVKRCCLLLSPISLFSLSSAKRLFYVFLVFTETNLARLEIYTEITALLKQIVLLFEHTQGWKRLGQTVSIILCFSMFNVMATNKVFSYHSISISLLQYVSCVKKKSAPFLSVRSYKLQSFLRRSVWFPLFSFFEF